MPIITKQIGPCFAAEVEGIDMRKPLSPDEVAAIHAGMDTYAVLVFHETVANLPFETFCRDQAVFGDAAEVIDRLAAARDEFGLSQIICWFDQGSMLPRREVERTMREFADQVMPKV